VAADDEPMADLVGALGACAAWHRTPAVVVRRSEPAELAGHLQRALEAGV